MEYRAQTSYPNNDETGQFDESLMPTCRLNDDDSAARQREGSAVSEAVGNATYDRTYTSVPQP